MTCPQCRTSVADGTSICPKCDYIIDASFLSDEPPQGGGDDTPPRLTSRPSPSRPRPSPKLRPKGVTHDGRTATGERATSRPRPKPADDTRIKSMEELEQTRTRRQPPRTSPRMPEAPPRTVREPKKHQEEDWRWKKYDAPEPAAQAAPPPSESEGSAYPPGAEDAFQEAKKFVRELSTADKLTVAGCALNVLISFFPWKETALEGEILGLMSLGFPVTVVSVLTVMAVVVRVRSFLPKLSPLVSWIVQLLGISFCIVWCLAYIKMSWDRQMVRSPVGNYEMPVSMPSFGVFIALISSVLGLGGTLLGLKEKPQ